MEKKFKYSREELVSIIRSHEVTNDGLYWCPYVCDMLFDSGDNVDTKYAYSRKLFENKMYFAETDIELFLSERHIYNLFEDEYYNKSLRFRKTNGELVKLKVDDVVPGKEFTIGELVDCYEYII